MDATITFNRFEKVRDELIEMLTRVLDIVDRQILEEVYCNKPEPIARVFFPKWRKPRQPPTIGEVFTEPELAHYVEHGVDSWRLQTSLGPTLMKLISMHQATTSLRKRLADGFTEAIHLKAVSVTLTQDDIVNIGDARTWLEPTS